VNDDNRVVQGLWIGPELSAMEQLSVASYLAHGHDFHLYVYEAVRNVPAGTTVRDASEILPASRIFQYSGHATYAGFANFFRYRLLLNRGGWWSDMDSVCLRALDFPESYVFSSELSNGLQMTNNGVLKVPRGSELIAYAWDICQSKSPEKLVWGETGPALMREAVERFSLTEHVKPPAAFCPIGFRAWRDLLDPDADLAFGDDTYAVHLWHEQWRAAGQDKDRHYHPGCLYERLRQRYLERQERISLDRIESILSRLTS